MSFQRLGAAIAAVSVLTACTDTSGPTQGREEPSSIESAISALGFQTEAMIEDGDFIVVEGDIALPKARLARAAARVNRQADTRKKLNQLGPNFQWVTDARVSAPVVSNMVVDLSGISSDQLWLEAARSAMANWNAVPGTTIYFSEGSPAQIQVVLRNLGRSTPHAWAHFPIGATGQPGDSIVINTMAPSLSASQKLHTMVHELGHTIGFRHTNWQGYQCTTSYIVEDQYPEGANQVAGTPQTDATSVMNGCSENAWNGFSNYDQVAASVLYNNLSVTESNVGGYPVVLSTYPRGAMSVELFIEYSHTEWYDHLSQWQTTYYYEPLGAPASGGSSNVSLPWGYAYCDDWSSHPWPQDHAGYTLRVVYPQRTGYAFADAHVLDRPGSNCY
jgi:hypothetical protein